VAVVVIAHPWLLLAGAAAAGVLLAGVLVWEACELLDGAEFPW
jgi:hypothetical protein